MMRVVFDMETQDPDDFLTLLLLLGHPDVDLRAVTIAPGSAHQVGLVREALSWFGADIPVGAFNLDHPKTCVSKWHYRAYGKVAPSREAEPGWEVLLRCCDAETTLVTGAPLRNLGRALDHPDFELGRWVAQGGFAGMGVVPVEKQLDKFKGMRICPTFNLNGDPRAAIRAIADPRIGEKRFVSKNVCHGVVYDRAFHARFGRKMAGAPWLSRIWQGMEAYLSRKPGKKFHDPLAACCAIDPEIGQWAEVDLFREQGKWGSALEPGSGVWIIVDYDPERFFEVLTQRRPKAKLAV